jgi:cell division protein FtsQ
MARQTRAKKIKFKLPNFIQDMKERLLPNLISLCVFLLFIVTAVFLSRAFIHGSDYFRLRCVETRGVADAAVSSAINNQTLSAHKNRNIFDIDIKAIARALSSRYPDAKDLIVRRSLPDTLTVSLTMRKPIALLENGGRYYAVDSEGAVLFNVGQTNTESLPVISGVSVHYNGTQARKNESRNLRAALELINEIRRTRFLRSWHVTRVNALDMNDISFYLDGELEVKIGFENFRSRLDALRGTLKDPRLVKEKVRYIDVRFEDVVIGPK